MPTQAVGPMYQFGDFRLDCGRFELFRNGHSLRVERKPMELLILLATRESQLVTRAEIAQRLWSSEVFVDTEHGINTAIRKLRYLLRDDSEDPKFIQTVTGMGYRFICAIEVSEEARPDAVQPVDPPAPANPVPTSEVRKDERRKRVPAWLLPAAGILVLSLAGAAWYLLRPLPQPRITEYRQITHDGVQRWVAGTDGMRLFVVSLAGKVKAAQVDISTGEATNLPIAMEFTVPGPVSPDGETLLVFQGTDRTLWTTSTQGGSLRRLSDKSIDSVVWSPDGKSLIYTLENGDVYVMRSDGTDVHKLTSVGGPVFDIDWSPDGKTIRYTKDDALWQMTSSGSNPHRLLPDWPASQGIYCGRWTPDGEFFLFVAGRARLHEWGYKMQMGQLWALDERRRLFRRLPAEPVKLTAEAIGWWDPIFNKDGQKIFARGLTPRGELLRYDPKTRMIEPYLGGISAEFVTFSPDGKSLAYVTFPEGILWRANRDGSGRVQMTDPPMYPILPRWSPDGRQILFMASPGLHGSDVMFIMPAEGGKPQRLLPRENGSEADPNWSPDGRKVVFWDGVHNDIRILDITSHQVMVLPGSDGLFSPRWSPDGRTIAVFDPPNNRTKLFDFARQRWSTLVDMGPGEFIEWSPDSRYIYSLCLGDSPGVCRINIEKNRLERVVDMKGFRPTGLINAWIGLDPSGAPLILRDAGLAEIYALSFEVK